MSKSIAIVMTAIAAAIAIVVASLAAAIDVYAQNTTSIQQQALNLTDTAKTKMITTTTTTIPISGLNASIIINAINAKIKPIYDHGNIDVPTNLDSATITKIDNKNTVR